VKVAAFRARHGLSQSQLARQLGMRQPHVARLQSGDQEPSLATLARLADATGLAFSIEVNATGFGCAGTPMEEIWSQVEKIRAADGLAQPGSAGSLLDAEWAMLSRTDDRQATCLPGGADTEPGRLRPAPGPGGAGLAAA